MNGKNPENRSDNIEFETFSSRSNLSENTIEANISRSVYEEKTYENTEESQHASSTPEQCSDDDLKHNTGETIVQVQPTLQTEIELGSHQGPSSGIALGSGNRSAFSSTNGPGVFYVPATAPQMSQDTDNLAGIEPYEVHLNPEVAFSSEPVAPVGFQEPIQVDMVNELIVDGKVVKRQNMIPYQFGYFLMFVTSIAVIVIIFVFTESEEPIIIGSTFQPTLSPTISISPTTVFDYDSYVKQLLIPIAGESTLNNSSSMEHMMWKFVAGSMPRLLNESILGINDTQQIIQRYIIGIIRVKLSAKPDYYLDLMGKQKYGKVCDFVPCDENEEITVLELRNQWSIGLGGGIIATEIGELRQLKDLILPRNGIRGRIPTEIGLLKDLEVLDLQQNRMTGTIPTELGNLQKLDLMFLDSNFLEQSIPSQLGNCMSMTFMNMSMNSLTGSIPTSLDNMSKLKGLTLEGNSLTGSAEFLCDHNFSTGSSFYDIDYLSQPYTYVVRYGVVVDCIENQPILDCSCCSCQHEV